MTHLTSDQLVDAVEGTLSADRAGHLEQCATCRASAESLRVVLRDVQLASTDPEPSPLFWDHFSRRVRTATDAERVPVTWWRSVWGPVVAVSATAGAIALAVLIRQGSALPTGVPAPPAPTVATVDADVSEIITSVAGDLSFEELKQSDLVPSRAAVDVAVSKLSESQQRELMRLVNERLAGSE